MDIIRVENLCVHYANGRASYCAVDNLSFGVRAGEIVGFLGNNGAGKSSTIKALMGFQKPSSGSAFLFGENINAVASRQRVGFLPETALYSPYLTPRETLRQYGELSGLSLSQITAVTDTVLEKTGVRSKADVLNRTLSKGMLQRVGLAQALMNRPELLILDEVSSGLDPIGRRDLRTLLLAERERGATIFFSSHQLSEVESVCDRILILNHGRLIAERTIKDIRAAEPSLEDYFVRVVSDSMLAEAGVSR
jgi:ABC-2 type transport system ATP-binding protein